MFKFAGLIPCISLFMTASAFAADTSDCVVLTREQGNNCASRDSLQIKVTNKCSENVYVKMCLERKDGQWNCGSDSILKPGRTNTGFYACHGTGNYQWSSCTGGFKECGFRSP